MEPLPAFDRTKLAEQAIVLIVPSQDNVWVKSSELSVGRKSHRASA